jgi:hypothetical protein
MSIVGGTEQRVNTTTTDAQNNSVVMGLSDGGWVVAWQSLGQDGSDYGIYQQRYDASGVALGTETRVNLHTPYDQSHPSIAGLTNGGWVVTWQSLNQDGSGWGTYQQVYDASGAVLWSENYVNAGTGRVVTALDDGRFLTAMTSAQFTYATLSDASTKTNEHLGAYNGAGMHNHDTSVATLLDGGWIITWSNTDAQATPSRIFQMRFDAEGIAVGDAELVKDLPYGEQKAAAVTALQDGGWAVVWQGDEPEDGIYMQRYSAGGDKPYGMVYVNQTQTGSHSLPDITTLDSGNMVVVWQGNGEGDDDGIYMSIFDVAGEQVVDEFLVNTVTAGGQANPSVTALPDGKWVVTWEGAGDGDVDGIYQRVFARDEIDADGYSSTQIIDSTKPHNLKPSYFETDYDPDSAVVITGLPSNGALMLGDEPVAGQSIDIKDIRDGLLIWTPNDGQTVSGVTSIPFVVLDEGETYTGKEYAYHLKLDAKPLVATPLADLAIVENIPFTFAIPAGTFIDPEGGTLNYSARLADGSSLPWWLQFDQSTGTLYSSFSDISTISVTVTAHDSAGGSAKSTFSLAVTETQSAPFYTQFYAQTTAYEEKATTSSNLAYFIYDADNTVSFAVTTADGQAIDWATISSTGGTPSFDDASIFYNYIDLVIQADSSEVGTHNLKITATYRQGGTAEFYHQVTIVNVNDAPVALSSRIRIDEGSSHQFQVSDFGFTDEEGDGLQALIITGLPGAGKLTLDGTRVTKGMEISAEDIASLVWTPAKDGFGNGYSRLSFQVIDDGGTDHGGSNRSEAAATITFDVTPEPHRVCRRLQLLREWSRYEQDNEQVFT